MNWKKIGIAAGAFGMAYLLFKGSSKPKMIDVVNTLTRASAFDKRNLSDIKNVVVHHTAGSPNDTPEAIAAYHVNSRGFRGIGYHIVIDKTGKIFLCNYLDSISSHIGGKNLSSIGVCCIGNFENYDVPAPQYKALLSVLAWLKKEFKGIRIVPHKLWSSTACPGDYMMARLFPSGPDSPSAIGAIIDKNSLKETTRCSDGSYSTAKGKPCLTRGGVHKVQKSIFEVFKGGKRESSSDKCLNALGFPYFETFWVPLNSINTDEASFQNRRAKYSKESASKIIEAVQEGKFLWGVFDPIILWLNPQDKKLYVLSGHSRFNSFKELDKLGLSAQGKKFDRIPAKIVETDFETAKRIALNSNSLATPETLLERTYYYRALLDSNMPKDTVKETIKRMELGNFALIWSWVHLNPDGKAMDALRAFEGKDITSNENLKQITNWLGSTREKFPILSDFHENEMFDFLIKGGYGKQFTRLPDFQEKIKTIISQRETMFTSLEPDQPLNLSATTTKSHYQLEYESRLNEAKKRLSDMQAERTKALQQLQKDKASRAEIDRILEPQDKAIRTQELKLAELLKQKGQVLTAERSAPGLFGIEELPVVPKPGDVVFLDIEASARMSPDIAYVLNQENQDTIKRGIIDLYYVGDFDQLNGTSIVNIAAIAVFAPNDDNRHLAYQLINNLRYYYSNMANLLNYE